MRRVFWVALGASVGVLVVRRLSRTAAAYTPQALGRSVAGAAESLRDLASIVREGMAEREQELRLALGVDAGEGDSRQANGHSRQVNGQSRQADQQSRPAE